MGFLHFSYSDFHCTAVGWCGRGGGERALRDFSQVIYVSFIFLGHFYYKRNYLHSVTFIAILCWLSAFLALIYLAEHYLFETDYFIEYIFDWRVVFAFSFVCLFARFICVPGWTNLRFPSVVLMLLVIVLFAIEIRTRAFLLMLVISAIVVYVGFLGVPKSKSDILRFSLSMFMLLLVGLVPILVGLVDFDLSDQSSLNRLMVLADSSEYDVTVKYRLDAWAMAASGIVENPIFGKGFGSYLYLDPWINGEYQYYPSAMIHNALLQIFYVGGIAHLVGYLVLFYGVFKYAGYNYVNAQPKEITAIRLIFRGFLIGYLFYAALGTTLFAVNEAAVFWFLVGYFCHYSIPAYKQSVRFKLFPMLYKKRPQLQ